MDITRITRKYVEVPVTATLRDGTTATIAGVDVAILARNTQPSAATSWLSATYAAGAVTVLIAGPDASPTGALVIPPAGADLWGRVVDTPEVDAARLVSIRIT